MSAYAAVIGAPVPKMVPYLTPNQRLALAASYLVLVFAATVIARTTAPSDDMFFALVLAAAIFGGLAAWSWWAAHYCPSIASDERKRRYAEEMLTLPLWRSELFFALIFGIPQSVVAGRDISPDGIGFMIAAGAPISYLAGVAITHFERKSAAKRLGRDRY